MNLDLAKVVVILALGFGSLITGMLPAALSRYNLRQNLVLQTVLLCFGAGILFATSLVHMLPEVSLSIISVRTFIYVPKLRINRCVRI